MDILVCFKVLAGWYKCTSRKKHCCNLALIDRYKLKKCCYVVADARRDRQYKTDGSAIGKLQGLNHITVYVYYLDQGVHPPEPKKHFPPFPKNM